MTNFYLVHKNPAVVETIRQAIGGIPDTNLLGVGQYGKDALNAIGSNPIGVAIIQLALDDMNGLELLRQLTSKYPDLYVVPVLEGNEGGQVWQTLLELDLKHVINGPTEVHRMIEIFNHAIQIAQQKGSAETQRGKSYMIAIASARGGVGKSVLATNLAIAMARSKNEVLLVDYSMNAGDFITMLDQVPRNSMVDVISAGNNMDKNYFSNLVSDHSLGFKYLSCPNNDFDYYSFSQESAESTLDVSRNLSEFVIVDTGVWDLPPSLAAVTQADLIMLVTTRDLARLLALQRFIKFLKEQREILTDKIKVVVNNAEVGTELEDKEISGVIEHNVTAFLPSIATLATFSINSGKPLFSTKADHPYCLVVNKLAERCVNRWIGS